MIKKILIAAAALVILVVAAVIILVMAVSGDYRVEREVTINKPKTEVFAYIKQLKNQNEWGPWHKRDPAMKTEFRGTDGTVGFVSAWKSEKPDVGSGEQEIKKITENERFDTEIRFMEPFPSKSDAWITTEAVGENQTKVKWGFAGNMPRPANLMLLVMDMNDAVGPDFEEGLSSLKAKLEK
jgi:hypothetical protein